MSLRFYGGGLLDLVVKERIGPTESGYATVVGKTMVLKTVLFERSTPTSFAPP